MSGVLQKYLGWGIQKMGQKIFGLWKVAYKFWAVNWIFPYKFWAKKFLEYGKWPINFGP